ncbi:amino acid ABC transporter permease [Ferruginivarius sediminum]|uniref:Putative glutamine transport system permease protein GlnP n=1 Tax=Ferruginivarius sediminum TaxID=2661937 RepID=A0A369T6A1_9PROT|nr:ABC transporter permease subunit [Ferruginivarius sediminum]RDD60798.1 ABC transporter permease subunit [Ferruginivarius sediminum]
MSGFEFKWSVVLNSVPTLLGGAELTLIITIGGLLFGFILGTVAGLMKLSGKPVIRPVANCYIEAIRGTPFMVQVMFLYFGVPLALGTRIPPLTAAIVAVAVNAGAYVAEIVRGAVQSIDRGQMEAGRSIGLSHRQAMLYVVWPQAFRRMIPPLGNQFIISLKDTSLLVVIGVGELTRTGQEIVAENFRAFEVWLAVAVIYFVMTYTLSRGLRYVEYRVSASERARSSST